jgi:vancomycin resistance protein YoaR
MGITENEKNKRNKTVMRIIISLCTLLVIYFGMAMYFTNHFYFGSKINYTSVSGKTVEEAKEQMTSELQTYTLNLKERDGKSEQIKGSDINLKYNSDGQYKSFKDKQNPFKWILAPFSTEDSAMTDKVLCNDKILKEKVDKLSCLNSSNIIEPKNPSFKYTDKGYVIVDGIKGNKVNKDILYNNVVKAILKGDTTIDLESTNCYVLPQYTSNSPKVTETKNILNKYVSSKIIYSFGNHEEYVDGSIINKWIEVNENLEIIIDKEKVKNYLDTVLGKYNTIGKTRSFVTSSGKTINIGGGDYGWSINDDKEIQDLSAVIKEGQTTQKNQHISKLLHRMIVMILETLMQK